MQWSSEFYLAPLCYRCVDLPRLGHNLFSAVSMRIRQIALATSHWACCQISRMPGGQFAPPPSAVYGPACYRVLPSDFRVGMQGICHTEQYRLSEDEEAAAGYFKCLSRT